MVEKIIREACVEDYAEAVKVIDKKVERIELNDNMSGWGTTPSYGTIQRTVEYANQHDVPVIVMNRPRNGDFVYLEAEKQIIMDDLEVIIELGATGIAFGCLDADDMIDKEFLEVIMEKSNEADLEVSFHRAFDSIPESDQFDSIKYLADLGVKRIITHGGPIDSDIMDNLDRLKDLNRVDERMIIIAGGEVRKDNYSEIVRETGLKEVHGTKII